MFSPSQPSTKSATAGPLATLMNARGVVRRAGGRRFLRRWAIRLAAVIAALIVVWLLFGVVVRIVTTDMWFNSVHQGSVYATTLKAQILLFCVFGIIAGAIGGLTMLALTRIRTPLPVSQEDDTFRWLFRRYESRVRLLLILLATVIPGILVGKRAAGGWQTYLLWRHATPWHTSDPLFHKDISFFVDVYPFHVMIVSLLTQSVKYAVYIAIFGGYWYGAWRLRRGKRKVTTEFVRLASLLLAGYLALKAANYWLSRYALTTSSRGPVTGPSYTDQHAVLPASYVLMSVALLCALALLANGVLVGRNRTPGHTGAFGRVRTLVGALVVTVVVSTVVGSSWPGVFFHFREAPSASKLDLGEIAHNQKATLAAFGLNGNITTVPYKQPTTTSSAALVQLAGSTAQTSLIDPNELSPTFNVEQQLQAYYGFKSTLDIGRYDLNGRSQDVAIAARELRTSGVPKKSWVNTHLVYTHGYGVVAAPTTEVDPKTQNPVFLNAGMPPSQEIPVSRPQIYFSPALASSYSIVGQPKGSTQQLEFDHPGGDGASTSAHTTYTGGGGIPVGSTLRRFLFAVQKGDPNILFSSELNGGSRLLTVRDPAARVAKVAPWLTLDGDEYPVVVNGQIKWVVDGYTSSSNYPNSQLLNLHSSTKTTLTANGASVAQPSTQVNYLQNSVKAVVDAYTGKVTLYSWNQQSHPDPLLKTWESAFPGLVKSQSDIPSALLPQLRYPTDLFNVQRTLLAKYHVTQPANFYSGNNYWKVPADPTVAAANTINASGQSVASTPLPSKYASLSADGYGAQRYSLSTPMVTLNGQQLAAFVSVDSEPGPNYGKFTVLNFPSGSGGESPAQVQNDIESDTSITEALTLQRGGNSKVVLGDLQAIPVAGRILYVEPVYTQSSGGASFPILRHVIALYGNGDPSFTTTLETAIKNAIVSETGTP